MLPTRNEPIIALHVTTGRSIELLLPATAVRFARRQRIFLRCIKYKFHSRSRNKQRSMAHSTVS